MKTFFILFSIGLLSLSFAGSAVAQSPQSFNYQAILRDNAGQVLTNQSLVLEFQLLEDSPTGVMAYLETHTDTTNSFGLVNLEIGTGVTTDSFDSLHWGQHQYYLQISMDRGNGLVPLGISPLLSVPYAIHSQTASDVDDADADPNNERQHLTISNHTVFINAGGSTGASNISLKPYHNRITQNEQDIVIQGFQINAAQDTANNAQATANLNQTTISSHVANDQDISATNEIQSLAFSNDSLFLSDGDTIFLGHLNDTTAITQLHSKVVADSVTLQNQISQNFTDFLSLESKQSGDSLLLSSTITGNMTLINSHIGNDLDTVPTNEIQSLSFSNDSLFLSDGNTVFLGHLNDTLALAQLQSKVAADSLDLQNQINQNSADFLSLATKQSTDSTAFSTQITGNSGSITALQIQVNNHVTIDQDTSATNELQSLIFSNDSLSIVGGNAVDLSPLKDGTGSDDQMLTLTSSNLTIEGANTVNLSGINTDQQQLSTTLHNLQLSNGGSVTVDTDPINEFQILTISGDTLFLKRTDGSNAQSVVILPQGFSGSFFDLSGIPTGLGDGDDNTQLSEAQVDNYVGNNGYLTMEVDGSNTNELQTISKSGNSIVLSNGGGAITDDVNDGDSDNTNEIQTLSKSGTTISLSNGGGVVTDAVDDADADPANEIQTISKSGNTVTLSNGGGSFNDDVNDADTSVNNELQTLSLVGQQLSLSINGGNVTLPASPWLKNGTNLYHSSGNVGVGTLTPSRPFEVVTGNSGVGVAAIRNNNITQSNQLDFLDNNGTQTLAIGSNNASFGGAPSAGFIWMFPNQPIRFGTNSTERLRITADGKFGFGLTNPTYRITLPNAAGVNGRGLANSWLTYSDNRIKLNQQPLSYGLVAILKLRPKQYDRHCSNFENDTLVLLDYSEKELGLIAQETYRVIPEVVQKPDDENTTLWSIDYEKLIPVLIKAIQEQQLQIEVLRAQIEANTGTKESLVRR